MEHAIYIQNLNDLKLFDRNKFNRIYFGTEFCGKLIPKNKDIKKITNSTKKTPLTFVTPWCTDNNINTLSKILPILPTNAEVVFNDWGLLKLIKKYKLIPILGRLLVSIKRDPRFNKNSKLPEYFKQSNINNPFFQEFLIKHGINRIELDNVIQGYNFKLKNKFKTSMYYPFVYITTSRKCIVSNVDSKNKIKLEKCNFECKNYTFSANLEQYNSKIILKGNSQFYVNKNMPSSLSKWKVNRLVYMPKLIF